MNPEINNLLEKNIEYAKLNADQAELILTKGTSFSTSSFNGKTDKLSINQGNTLGVRVIKNGKVGISYSEDLSDQSVKTSINQAIKNSEIMKDEPHEKIIGKNASVENTHKKNQLAKESSSEEKVNLSIKKF